jgi:ribosomal-protein-alanine N-acetyltransferase
VFSDGRFCGEINLNSIHRGPFQNAYVGYWIDQAMAGRSYMSECVVAVAKFAFEDLRLHRIQIAIIPRNHRSRRVMEKLNIREEGIAERYLEINGVWEDHVRFAITVEEWEKRRDEFHHDWL